MTDQWTKPLALIAACGLAAAAGYALGRSSSPATEEAGNLRAGRLEKAAASPGPRPVGGARAERERTEEEVTALKTRLMERFSISPWAWNDWALRQQAAALLATMTADELREFAGELDTPWGEMRDFPVSQGYGHALAREVFRQWALKDPAAASLGSFRHRWNHDVFGEWLKRDPAAAEAWVTGGNFPPGSEEAAAGIFQDFVRRKAGEDFEAARGHWQALERKGQEDVLWQWSRRFSGDADRREALLQMASSLNDEELYLRCVNTMTAGLAERSPAEAIAFLEESGLAGEERERMMPALLASWARQDPASALDHWLGLAEQTIPPAIHTGIYNWHLRDSAAAGAWVEKLGSGEMRDRFRQGVATGLTEEKNFDQAAEVVEAIRDPELRLRQLKVLKRQWDAHHPSGAEAWFGALSAEERAAIRGE